MPDIALALITAIVSSGVFATVLGFLFHRRSKQIEAEITLRMDQAAAAATSQRLWKERAVAELLGPVHMQLDRTRRAFERWNAKNLFLEAKVVREGNLAIRDALLEKGHLIPPSLLPDAGLLIEHYDRWLEEYEKQRLAEHPDLDAPFTFVGPLGYPFPREADERFRAAFKLLWNELYGVTTIGEAPVHLQRRASSPFAARRRGANPDVVAPDGSDVRILLGLAGGGMACFELACGETSTAVTHRTVEEVWYFLAGEGVMWRRQDGRDEVIDVSPGMCLTLPLGTAFQFRSTGSVPLEAVGVTMPPWPGDGEAVVVGGKWEPTVPRQVVSPL